MRILSSFLFLLLPAAVLAKSLRHAPAPAPQPIIDGSLTPQAAPAQVNPRSFAAQHRESTEGKRRRRRRRLNASTINAAVLEALPSINSAIQNNVPDPATIDKSYSRTFNDGTTCSGNDITVTGTIVEATGLSTSEITKLEVDDATDTLETDSCAGTSKFTGDFNYETIATSYSLTGSSDFSDSGSPTVCTANTNTVTGTVNKPKFTGVVYLEGTITSDTARITKAEVKSINAFCDTTSASFSSSLGDFSTAETTAGNQLSTEVKNTLSDTLSTTITNAINNGVSGSSADLGFLGGIPFLLELYKAATENQIANWEADVAATFQSWQEQTLTTLVKWQEQGQTILGNIGFTIEP